MAFDPHSNFGYSTVATAPSPAISGTSLTLSDASGFPAPGGQGYNVTIWPDGQQALSSNAEIVRVTALVGNVLTIVRAQEGTSARAIVTTDQVAVTVTAKTVTDIEAAIPSTAGLLSAINVSAGATSNNLSALTFSNGSGVSFGLTGSTLTASVATNYQSQGAYLTTAAISQDSSKYAGINGAITGGSITVNTSGVSVNLPAYLTTAALSQDSSKYAGTNGAITGGSITVNTSGVSVNLPAYLTTAMQSNAVTLSNIRVSAGTTSNLLSALTFSNANGLAFGLDAGTITGSYTVPAAQTVQTQNMIAASLSGNTAGVLALVSSGTAYFAGGNNITLSQNGQSITISGANAGGAQTAISGIVVSDATYTSGTVSFSGNNITIASSVNGATQYIKLSGNASQTNQSAIKGFGVSNTGQTAGNTGLSTGIDWVLAGSQSITLSQSTAGGGPNTIWFQHPAWVTTAISSQSTQFLAMTLAGNTAGTSTFHATNNASLFFNGGNNITLSGNGSTVTIIGPNTSAQQTGISGIIVSDGTYTSGTVSFSNAGNITINSSVNGATQYIKLSGNAAQTNQSAIKAFGVSNTGNTAGNTGVSTGIDWVMAGSGSLTLSQSTAGGGPNTIWWQHPAWLTTAALSGDTSKYVQAWELTGNTAGTTSSAQGTKLYFSGGNSITVSGSSNTVVFSVGNYLTTADLSANSSKYVQEWALTGNTAGTTSSAQGTRLYLSGGNSITISGSSNSLVFSVGNYLTTAALSGDTSKYAQAWELTGNTAGTTSSAQGTKWYLSGGNNITISGNSNTLVFSAASVAPSPVNFSAGTTSSNIGSVVFSNSNGVSFGLNGSTITATVSTYDTVGTATTGYPVASANSIGTVTRWAAEDHRHAGIGGFGISTSGNSSGTSGSNVGTYWLQGGNSITLSQITSNNGSHTIVVSGAKDGYNGWLEPYPLNTATQTLLPTAGSWYLAPFTAYGSVSGGRVNFLACNTGTANLFQDIGETAYKSNITGTVSQRFTFSGAMAIFSQGTGANSTQLESVWSNSHSWAWSKIVNVSTNAASNIAVSLAHSISYQSEIGSDGAYTNVQYANAGSSTIANSSGNSTLVSTVFSSGRNLISGSLVQPFGFSTTLTAGVYWMGYAWSTTRASASTGGQLSSGPDFGFSGLLGMSRLAVDSLFRNFGSTTSGARSMLIPYGVYTGGAAMAPPTAIALSSDLSSLASQWVPYFNFNYRGLTK